MGVVTTEFDLLSDVRPVLSGLSTRDQILYALACSENTFCAYQSFHRTTQFGDPLFFRNLLDSFWEFAGGREPNPASQKLRDDLLALVPEGHDYPGARAGMAQNFCICIDILLQLAMGISSKEASPQNVANYCLDSWRFLILSERPDIRRIDSAAESAIFADPRVQSWKEFQLEVLARLRSGDIQGLKSVAGTAQLPF